MIVRDLDLEGIVTAPHKADSILVIDANAVLSLPVAAKLFQPVSGRAFQVVKGCRIVEHREFPFRDARGRRTPRFASSPDFRRQFVGESPDH